MDYFGTFGYGHGHDHRHLQQAIDIAHVEGSARRTKTETADLRQTVERLRLATAAIWELTRDRAGMVDQDLLDKIREIDLRDGALDGRMRPAPSNCPACERVNKATRTACLYCGEQLGPRAAV